MSYSINWKLFENTRHGPAFEELQSSSGNKEVYDFSVPVNSYFLTANVIEDFYNKLPNALKYYPSANDSISEKLGQFLKIPSENIVMANGSTELITWIDHLFIKDSLLTSVPTFGRWTDQSLSTGKRLELYYRKKENNFSIDLQNFVDHVKKTKVRSLVICNPNNPTGQILSKAELIFLLQELKHLELFIVDESFIDFSTESDVPSVASEVNRFPNLIVLKSLGKSLGMHGVRLGYAISNPGRQKTLRQALPPWNVNGIGNLLIDLYIKYPLEFEKSRVQTIRDRIEFETKINELNFYKTYSSSSNFIFLEAPSPQEGLALRNHLLSQYGILTRECSNKIGSSAQYLRIASRPPEEQNYFMNALGEYTRQLNDQKRMEANFRKAS